MHLSRKKSGIKAGFVRVHPGTVSTPTATSVDDYIILLTGSAFSSVLMLTKPLPLLLARYTFRWGEVNTGNLLLDLRLLAKVYPAFMSSRTSTQTSLTVGKLAALAKVSANAVRFYEREGLMRVPAKTASGYRLYGPQAVERLCFIRQAQHCGFTLAEIQALLQLRDEASSCCDDVRSKVIEKKLELEARIKAMKSMSRGLDQLIAECSNGARPAEDCSILTSLSRASERPTS